MYCICIDVNPDIALVVSAWYWPVFNLDICSFVNACIWSNVNTNIPSVVNSDTALALNDAT